MWLWQVWGEQKPWKQMQPGLEVTVMCWNRKMMEVATQPKMSYFKKRLFIYVPVRFWNPAF